MVRNCCIQLQEFKEYVRQIISVGLTDDHPKSNLVYCQQRYIWPILRYVMYLGSIGCSSIKWNTCYSVWQRLDTPVWWQTRDTWQWLSVAHNQHAKYYSNSKCVSSQLQQAWVVHWRDHTLNADHTQAIFFYRLGMRKSDTHVETWMQSSRVGVITIALGSLVARLHK